MKSSSINFINYFKIFIGFFSLIFIYNIAPVVAQVHVKARIDTNIILIGDHLKLSLEVNHPANISVNFPMITDSIGRFELVSTGQTDSVKVAQPPSVNITKNFILTCFDSGYYIIPPFVFYYNNPGNTSFDSAMTEPLVITVNTITVNTNSEIKDIKPPMEIPFSLLEALPYFIGLVVIGLIIALIIYFIKRKKKPVVIAQKIPSRPAHEIALEELQKLDDEKVWQNGNTKLYYSRLTDIIRLYIENRFHIQALEQTTHDIMINLRERQLDPALLANLDEMLRLADLAKFAKVVPTPDSNQRSMSMAIEFVNATIATEKEIHQTEKEGGIINA